MLQKIYDYNVYLSILSRDNQYTTNQIVIHENKAKNKTIKENKIKTNQKQLKNAKWLICYSFWLKLDKTFVGREISHLWIEEILRNISFT